MKRRATTFGEDDTGLTATRSDSDVDLDITPMIDVVFLLLIFFMVTSTMQSKKELDVPPARNGTGVSSTDATIISLTKPPDSTTPPGVILSTGQPGSFDDIQKDVETGFGEGKAKVIIKADRDVLNKHTLEAMRKAAEVDGVQIFIEVRDDT